MNAYLPPSEHLPYGRVRLPKLSPIQQHRAGRLSRNNIHSHRMKSDSRTDPTRIQQFKQHHQSVIHLPISQNRSYCLKGKVVRDKWSKRYTINNRVAMHYAPLIIIGFEGVLGDFFCSNFWNEFKQLHVRPGIIQGLISLLQVCRVVLFVQDSDISQIIQFFEHHGVVFDGVYKSLNKKRKELLKYEEIKTRDKFTSKLQNYGQVIKDFKIKHPNQEMIVIGCLQASQEELNDGVHIDQFIGKQFRTIGAPIGSSSYPLTILIPDPRLNEDLKCFNWSIVQKLINSILEYRLSTENFISEFFQSLQNQHLKNFIAMETTKIHCKILQDKVWVNADQVRNILKDKRHLTQKSPPKYNGKITEFLHNQDNPSKFSRIIIRESKASTISLCKCPQDQKINCEIKSGQLCTTKRNFINYTINGDKIPENIKKSQFILIKGELNSVYTLANCY